MDVFVPGEAPLRVGLIRRRRIGVFLLTVLSTLGWPLGGCKSEKAASRGPEAPTPAPTLIGGETKLGDILVKSVTQGWGTPQLNMSVNRAPFSIGGKVYETGFGTHADSRIEISFPARYEKFSGSCGIDDEVSTRGGSVVFQVLTGDKALFESPPIKAGMAATEFSVPVKGLTGLTLIVQKAGETIDSDHADWVNLDLK